MKRAKVFALAAIRGVLAAAVVLAPVSAQDRESPAGRPTEAGAGGPGQLDRFLEETRTLQAEFSQELLDGGGNLIETASGTFSLKRPNRFLWSYSEPFEQQVVADAENLWIHDVELEQVTVSPLEGAIASSPAMLLSGDGQVRDGFEVVETSGDGTIAWVSLAPIEPGVDFRSVQVGFDAGELFALVLIDALGQVTSIQFRNMAVNLDIEDEFFRFEPPAGADVIGEPVDNAR
ncbi:MAG: outer membrane lipoprotein chaperone LolA [Rhodospirillaceae bacterium]|nr:outer membrane lipoprotein chaperone LolA [Rhodospirillaceae bacterium]